MPKVAKAVRKAPQSKRVIGPGCPRYRRKITSLGDYFNVLNHLLRSGGPFWFRGHANWEFNLTPSALRYRSPSKRDKALALLGDFKRFGEIKLPNLPSPDEQLKWVQLAQHYGLPTRLLDWTKNAAIALYFACLEDKYEKDDEDTDGAVVTLNPVDLNRAANPKNVRIFNIEEDKDVIDGYLELDGKRKRRELKTIAIDPVWNSERIMLQQGVFTLHGSKHFTLTDKQAPSLTYLRIRSEHKSELLKELERTGINEMAIFPEPEHMCRYLKWRENLLLKD